MSKTFRPILLILILTITVLTVGCTGISHKDNNQNNDISAYSSEPEELTVTDEFEVITEEDQEVGGF